MKRKISRAALQYHFLRLAEVPLQTYGRRGEALVETSDSDKLRLIETFIRGWQKEFFLLIDCDPYERITDDEL